MEEWIQNERREARETKEQGLQKEIFDILIAAALLFEPNFSDVTYFFIQSI